MRTAVGVVEGGRITLEGGVVLPEGARVVVEWNDEVSTPRPFLEREPLTEDDVRHDIEWATGRRWLKRSS